MSDIIKDGIYGYVSGTVGRTGTAKNGPYAVIEVQKDGSQYPDRVTAWGLDASTGDRVSVKGWLSWRKEDKDGKTYFNVNLNKPQVDKVEKSQQSTAPAAAADDWDRPQLSSEVPF